MSEAAVRVKVPHTLAIIFALIVTASIFTYLVPGGRYNRIEKQVKIGDSISTREVVDPASFQAVPAKPQNIWNMLHAIIKGMRHQSAVDIIFFILLIGGAFGIVTETRAVDAALESLVKALGPHDRAVIPVVMLVFSLGGASFGMCEETIPFVAMAVPLALRLGYDSLTGIAMVYLAAMTGFATAFLNPFTVGIAQGIADVRPFSGITYRFVLWLIFTFVTIFLVMRHAARVKLSPRHSPVYDLDEQKRHLIEESGGNIPLNPGRIMVLLCMTGGFAAIIYGAIRLGWYIDEMAVMFIAIGLLSGILIGLSPSIIAGSFVKGCSEICGAAIMVGFARAVLIILEDGGIMDTVLHGVSGFVGNFPAFLSVQLMYVFQTVINFFVPSGSGQAALTMPIMTPLADILRITRQTAVLAFQFGDGFNNVIIPTSSVTIAVLGIGVVPCERWAKCFFHFVLLHFALGAAALAAATAAGWNG
jgi:uncharacterized ion transporter superfamily protein YfcC